MRVNHMCRITDERKMVCHKGASDRQLERECAARANDLDLPEMETKALLKLGMKIRVRQSNNPRRLLCIFRPDNRGTPALEWQNRKRTGREEMLFSPAIVVALMRYGGDDRGLRIGPSGPLHAG